MRPTISYTSRRLSGALLGAVLIAALAAVGPIDARGGPVGCRNISPDRQIAIANNNVEEKDAADIANTADMERFVNRLINGASTAAGHEMPYSPDVVLLQEIQDKSARVIAGLLEDKTGCRFIVAVNPGDQYAKQFGNYAVFRETGILLNADTMTKEAPGGFVVTRYTRRQSSPAKRAFKSNAYGLAQEISSGLTISLASVHFVKDVSLRSPEVAKKKKEAWSRQIAKNLEAKYPNAELSSIGGDFNAHRCSSTTDFNCAGAPFWRALRYDFKYLDSYFAMHDFGRYIDYIWGKKFVVDADEDTKYNQDKDPFYSDHQFRWAILADRDEVKPEPFKIFKAEGWAGKNPRIKVGWTESFDGGGLLPYRIYQAKVDGAGDCLDFQEVDRVPTNALRTYENTSFKKGESRCYQVKAVDKAGNDRLATIKDPLDERTPGVKIVDDHTVRIRAGG